MGKNTVEAKQWLYKRYGDSAPGKSTIIDWYAEFKCGRTNTNNIERSGRPKSAVVPENITKVHKIVLGDRKLKLRVIADTLKISESSVSTILHESLGLHEFFVKWVPRMLTADQKLQRVEDSQRCLELFKGGKKDFLRWYMTTDETRIHYNTPETKRFHRTWWKPSKSTKNWTVSWQGYGVRILGRPWYFVYQLSWGK